MLTYQWIPTNDYYRRILDAPLDAPLESSGAASRGQLYHDLFVEPWQPMMQAVSRAIPAAADGQSDLLAGARLWGWLLPDQVEQMAALLEKLEAAHAWQRGEEALGRAVARFDPYAGHPALHEMSGDAITGWLVLADALRSNPLERGYTGATDWFSPRFIAQFWEPNADNLLRLPGLIAHEMHHLIRLRAFPWDMQRTSVADYIVVEGTAESFATSIFGEEVLGYYVSEFDEAQLETARAMIGEGLHTTGFDVIRAYIFGDALADRAGYKPLGGMPTYGGYAIGYHVVQAFMRRSGKSIEETTFLPSAEIIAGSGYFG